MSHTAGLKPRVLSRNKQEVAAGWLESVVVREAFPTVMVKGVDLKEVHLRRCC